jgi:hypothetical protein
MSKEVVCPFCKKSNPVEKYSFSGELAYDLPEIKCPNCSKSWGENVIEAGRLAKSAPSNELAELRVQLNAQFAELLSKINGLTERRAAAPRSVSFQPQGYEPATVLKFVAGMPGGLMLEPNTAELAEESRQESAFVTKSANREAVAHAELQKALANGKPVTSPNYVRANDGLEKGAPARFSTAESVAPGVQQFHNTPGAPNVERAFTAAPDEHRPFQPGGETDLGKAHSAVKHALANGKPVGR